MSGLLSCLGFPVETEEDFFDLIKRTASEGEVVETGSGTYHLWTPGQGVELWAQRDEDGELIGLNPHFAGDGVASLILDRSFTFGGGEDPEEAEGNPMDGGFVGSPIYQEQVAQEEELELVFDTPDFLTYGPLTLPGLFGVQLAAFAHEMVVHPDEASYLAEPGNRDFGCQSFIPWGLYTEEGEYADPPQAQAVFAGKVMECARKVNPATGRPFLWAKVQTEDLLIDLVADPDDLEEDLAPDAVVQGTFWISGRLLDP